MFLSALDDALGRINSSPFLYQTVDADVRRALMRKFPYGVYFLVDGDKRVVLAVLHLKMHPDTWRSRLKDSVD